MKKIIGLIPVRLNSSRLKQKALLEIEGIPIIIHTMKRAMMSKKLNKVIICTDSLKISSIVEKFGGISLLTNSNHKNGTERIAEIANKVHSDLYIDIQGDEPLVDPKHIDYLIDWHLQNEQFDIVVPFLNMNNGKDKNIVKIVSDNNNKVIYFSRSESPYPFKDNRFKFKKHLSIISFKKKSLLKFSKLKQGNIEKIESIELMRAIENNIPIGTFKLNGDSFSIDIKKNYNHAKKIMKNDKYFQKYKI